jgi:hypothetical protein
MCANDQRTGASRKVLDAPNRNLLIIETAHHSTCHACELYVLAPRIPIHAHFLDTIRQWMFADLLVIRYPCNSPTPMCPAGDIRIRSGS